MVLVLLGYSSSSHAVDDLYPGREAGLSQKHVGNRSLYLFFFYACCKKNQGTCATRRHTFPEAAARHVYILLLFLLKPGGKHILSSSLPG